MFFKMQLIMVLVFFVVIWNEIDADKSVCHLQVDLGPCEGYFPKWFFNKKTKNCEKFIYGGCDGNKNRFDTEEKCIAMCRCKLHAKKGPCRAKLKRWFHNKKTKECQIFYYGGCKGNANRFHTEMECRKACKRCYRPPETGSCRGYFLRYYYDYKEEKCKKFMYGGCRGNTNNFKTKAKCVKACYKAYGWSGG